MAAFQTRTLGALALITSACVGQVDDRTETSSPTNRPPSAQARTQPGQTPDPATPTTGTPDPKTAPLCAVSGKEASPRRIWRLSEPQYAATLKWMLPAGASMPSNPFRGLKSQERFSTGAGDVGMPELAVEQLFAATETAAATIIRDLKTAVPCLATAAPDLACYREVVTRVGPKALRRPLSADEVARYSSAMIEARSSIGAQFALELGVEALLARPEAVFRVEVGSGNPDAAGRVRLSPFELASAISYSVTHGPPDAALWAAAESGALTNPADVRAQVVRLWTSAAPGPRAVIEQFFREYFQYDGHVAKDAKLFPGHNADALTKDTTLFLQDLFFDQRKDFIKNLFTSGSGFADASTAGSYGLAGLPMGMKQKVVFPPGQRFGILTQPSFLAALSGPNENHPVQRGRFIREDILCQDVPPIPIEMIPPLPNLGPNATQRERLAMHSVGTCAGCHRLMDPLGLVLEQFDHSGRFRTMEGGRPVDTSGAMIGLGAAEIPLSGPGDLGRTLAEAPEVRDCFSRQAFQFLMGRAAVPTDTCAMGLMQEALAKDGDAIAAFAALMGSDAVVYRFAK